MGKEPLQSLVTLGSSGGYHCVMIGLDGSGKTTILFRLKYGQYTNTVPTIGFNCEKVTNCGNCHDWQLELIKPNNLVENLESVRAKQFFNILQLTIWHDRWLVSLWENKMKCILAMKNILAIWHEIFSHQLRWKIFLLMG